MENEKLDELVDAMCGPCDSETTTAMKLSDEQARQAHWIVEQCERTYTPSKEIQVDFEILDKFAYKDDDKASLTLFGVMCVDSTLPSIHCYSRGPR